MVSRSSITQNKPNSAVVTYSTLTVAAVGFFAYYLYHKLQNRRRRRDDDNNEENTQNNRRRNTHHPRHTDFNQERDQRGLAARLFGTTPIRKHRLSISMKNTLLKKLLSTSTSLPSSSSSTSDTNTSVYVFLENAVSFLQLICKRYDVYLVCPISNEQEKHQIISLLSNENLFSTKVIDKRKVIFCETEEGKVHIIRHIKASVHIESGLNNEDVVGLVRSFVDNVIWVLYDNDYFDYYNGGSRKVNSDELSPNVEDRKQWTNVEICSDLWKCSLARLC
ncbi:11447_t:CDS:2 [Entrophospora sp. SA101]|nr:11447_t:CDS:2 [Entrophospora sp. SA101]